MIDEIRLSCSAILRLLSRQKRAFRSYRRPKLQDRRWLGSPHRPMRPTWLCRVCAAPWPCQPARLLLGLEYRGDRAGLAVYMAGMLFDATADLLALNPNPGPGPVEMFERFISWTGPATR
ncbi:hypothetical protein [Micromonospora ureilytica]|uniref:hypothetical protein n=1 Tax=Micromonospora ureilytica TaxID=709868 RepID=UPI002E10B0A6|nr:hypothetical protein OHB55_22505 [Micromonospora ureilytica]